MRLLVLHEDESPDVITLSGEVRIVEGKHLNRIISNGVEHFFTHDGFYDGWGHEHCSTST